MTLQEIISIVDRLEPNTYDNEIKTSFINEVEMMIIKLVKWPQSFYPLKRIKDQTVYDLPAAIDFDNIATVLLNKVTIPKVGLSHDEELPGYRESGDGIEIFPLSTSDSTKEDIKIIYNVKQEKLKFESDKDVVLVATPPFDEMYQLYLIAKINFYNDNYLKYNNFIDQYNTLLNEYKIRIIRNKPLNKKENKMTNIW